MALRDTVSVIIEELGEIDDEGFSFEMVAPSVAIVCVSPTNEGRARLTTIRRRCAAKGLAVESYGANGITIR